MEVASLYTDMDLPDEVAGLQLNFSRGVLRVGVDPNTDEVTLNASDFASHGWVPAAHEGVSQKLIGGRLCGFWELHNQQGYRDAVQVCLARGKRFHHLQALAIGSSLRLYEYATPKSPLTDRPLASACGLDLGVAYDRCEVLQSAVVQPTGAGSGVAGEIRLHFEGQVMRIRQTARRGALSLDVRPGVAAGPTAPSPWVAALGSRLSWLWSLRDWTGNTNGLQLQFHGPRGEVTVQIRASHDGLAIHELTELTDTRRLAPRAQD